MMAYARQVLRDYTQISSIASSRRQKDAGVENPFSADMPEGQGWRGRLGRMMVWVGKGYFLGGPVDDSWAKDVNSRFKSPISTQSE